MVRAEHFLPRAGPRSLQSADRVPAPVRRKAGRRQAGLAPVSVSRDFSAELGKGREQVGGGARQGRSEQRSGRPGGPRRASGSGRGRGRCGPGGAGRPAPLGCRFRGLLAPLPAPTRRTPQGHPGSRRGPSPVVRIGAPRRNLGGSRPADGRRAHVPPPRGQSPERLSTSHSRGPQKIAARAESSSCTGSAMSARPRGLGASASAATSAARGSAAPRPPGGARARAAGREGRWSSAWQRLLLDSQRDLTSSFRTHGRLKAFTRDSSAPHGCPAHLLLS